MVYIIVLYDTIYTRFTQIHSVWASPSPHVLLSKLPFSRRLLDIVQIQVSCQAWSISGVAAGWLAGTNLAECVKLEMQILKFLMSMGSRPI